MLILGKVRKRPTRVGRFRFLPVSRQTALRPGGGGLGRGASSDQPLVLWQHHSLSLSYRFAFKLFGNLFGNNESMRKLTIRCFVSFVLAIVFSAVAPSTVFAQSGGDVVMVLPFENTSSRPEYNWVGESFADALAELLNKPGLLVVSGDDRQLAYQRLRLPETVIPSRATAIKLAREAKASMIVIGTYSVTPAPEESKSERAKSGKDKPSAEAYVQVTARVIKVNEGRTLGELFDGGW